MRNIKNVLLTGGAGFIGSNLVIYLINKYPNYNIVTLDALTYSGNLANHKIVKNKSNYFFENLDINDQEDKLLHVFEKYQIDTVLHLAAESHVDRSISNPLSFVNTNVLGTVKLLNAAKEYWKAKKDEQVLFYHISTDEVYGSLGAEGFFTEVSPYDPRSPYAASKASSDHFVRAYSHTYNMPTIISNCSNNYGPYQFPEKLIPLFINNIIEKKPLPVYGKGENVRDWLYVEDHCKAIDTILHKGKNGDTYNIGGFNEWKNIDLIHLLCKIVDEKLGNAFGTSQKLIKHIIDRPGHDMRYAIDASKIKNELHWQPEQSFETGLPITVDWYLNNAEWLQNITSGAYQQYYQQQYKLS